jgi:hypothetical protein
VNTYEQNTGKKWMGGIGNMNIEINDILIGIVMIIFGILIIVIPNSLDILVGSGFVLVGLLKFVPDKAKE